MQNSKAGTGRVVAFRELGLVNALTLEASFAGAAAGRRAERHFNTRDLEEMGAALVRAPGFYARADGAQLLRVCVLGEHWL